MQENRYIINVHETDGSTYSNIVYNDFELFSVVTSDKVEKIDVVFNTKNNYFKDKVFVLKKK